MISNLKTPIKYTLYILIICSIGYAGFLYYSDDSELKNTATDDTELFLPENPYEETSAVAIEDETDETIPLLDELTENTDIEDKLSKIILPVEDLPENNLAQEDSSEIESTDNIISEESNISEETETADTDPKNTNDETTTPVNGPGIEQTKPTAVSDISIPGCPDCTLIEHILLDLGYLNQLLTILEEIEKKTNTLPDSLKPVIADIIKKDYPRIAPLINTSVRAQENTDPIQLLDKKTVITLIHDEINRDSQKQVKKDLPRRLGINDIKVVFARIGDPDKNRLSRVHINAGDKREIITTGRGLKRNGINIILSEITPSPDPHRSHAQVYVKDINTGKTHRLNWIK